MKRGNREVRIIGGIFRGRKLRFPEDAIIRPTPDRVRETLFNWLQPFLHGARCLDLFAGSGALGAEALSRGASRAVFVDASRSAITALKATLEQVRAEGAEFVIDNAGHFLREPGGPYDVVFLDPPFGEGHLEPALAQLAAKGCLAQGAFLYIEQPNKQPLPPMPAHWHLHREGHAGEVAYYLFRNLPPSQP